MRAVPVDLRHDWPAALREAGFDTGRPAAWAAEGLLGFLPSDAQDRLLDNVTALSADGSQLVAEVFLNSGANQQALNAATGRWQEHGLDVELENLGFPGERNDVATYLARPRLAPGAHGAESVVGRQRITAAARPTTDDALFQELLLHRGVARGRLKERPQNAEQQARQAT